MNCLTSIATVLITGALWQTQLSLHAAVITEPFNSYPGNTTDPGWTSPWSDPNATATVATGDPVNGGGSYLSVTHDITGDSAIVRTLDPAVLNTQITPYTISWDVRFDTLGDFSSYGDRVHFTANTAGSPGSNDTASWLIGVVGGDNGGIDYFDGVWYFYDNISTTANGSFNSNSMVNTGMQLVEGDTYSFLVNVDPTAQTYSATITNLDTMETFSSSDMNFRNQDTSSSFQNLVFGGTQSSTTDGRTYSLDNVSITPEPGRMMLLSSAIVITLLRRRRA